MRSLRFRTIFRIISRILIILSIFLLINGLLAFFMNEPVQPFLLASASPLLIGFLLLKALSGDDEQSPMNRREAYLAVTLSWLLMSLTGSLPYLISGSIPKFTDAVFESVSGFTTTGASILTDIETLPLSILFWRSLTHWIGGIGIIVLVIIIMPQLKIGGYNLFVMESSLQEKIRPRVKSIGKRLLAIYTGLTIIEIILLLIGGMNLFESTCHAFGTIATGGFSPKNTSIAGYSPYIQYVIMVFMLLAGTNFTIHYFLLKKDFVSIRQNDEFRFYLAVVLITALIISGSLVMDAGTPLEPALREGFFQTISIITCTGFATADYLQWPVYAWMIIFFSMFLGGSTGSTAGGIKMARHLIALRNIKLIFTRMNSPNAVLSVRINRKVLSEENNNSVLTFIAVYLLIFAAGSIGLVLMGIDGSSAVGSAATCMAGIGPGIGSVGPASNFAHLPDAAKLLLSLLMLMGRLEIYTVIILFSRNYWKV